MQDERDAWIFIGTSLNEPLDDAASWPPALARQTSAYSALSHEQKEYLGRNLVPLLLARKDEFATSGHKVFFLVACQRLDARAVHARKLRCRSPLASARLLQRD